VVPRSREASVVASDDLTGGRSKAIRIVSILLPYCRWIWGLRKQGIVHTMTSCRQEAALRIAKEIVMGTVKVSVNLPEDSVASLKALAKREGISMTEALRRSISLQEFVDEQESEGSAILVKDKDDNVQRLVIR